MPQIKSSSLESFFFVIRYKSQLLFQQNDREKKKNNRQRGARMKWREGDGSKDVSVQLKEE